MIWREQINHIDDCYFCCTNVKGFNARNKNKIVYANVTSATRPISHGPNIPVPLPISISYLSSTSSEQNLQSQESNKNFKPILNQPQKFTQGELNDLIRDLGLSKESAQLLGSRLHTKNLLAPNTLFAWYRKREKEFVTFFSQKESLPLFLTRVVYCTNISGLIEKLGAQYDPGAWRLFIDSLKQSLKGVLLHNTN
ncbi:GSCOCG00011665001-RA-CDS, partial [Cotesia congregata]